METRIKQQLRTPQYYTMNINMESSTFFHTLEKLPKQLQSVKRIYFFLYVLVTNKVLGYWVFFDQEKQSHINIQVTVNNFYFELTAK